MSEQETHCRILPIMLGTAGHVDHGKTSLVKHLTGENTDRLAEEQRRGLSIDLAVAPCELPGGRIAGIIDVPGHEDFIRNMVSGASSIDVLILVVAADDAVMPQTVEHMRIAKLMGMSQVMVVITKVDLVDQELLSLVQDDICDFIKQAGYPEVPIVSVSNVSGEGIEQVREVLGELVAKVDREPDKNAFRMYIRHVFSVKGYGTVVTGVPCLGQVRVGDGVELLPAGKSSKVRAIQTYKRDSESSQAHLSSAINLRDLNAEEISRGMTISSPGVYPAVQQALVWVRNESDFRKLKRRSKLRFHCGTASVAAGGQLIDCEELLPAGEAFLHLRFQQPIVVAAGDKFILRLLSPADTIGGGLVLSVNLKRVRRSSPFLLPRLRCALEAAKADDVLGSELYAGSNPLIRVEDLPSLTQLDGPESKTLVLQKEQDKVLIPLGTGRWLLAQRAAEVCELFRRMLSRYHRENKYAWGMKGGHATALLGLDPKASSALIEVLTADQEIVLRHGHLSLKSFKPEISERDIKLRESVMEKVLAAGVQTIAKGNLKGELSMSTAELKLILRLLVDQGVLTVLGSNLLSRSILEELRNQLLELFKEQQIVELGVFRERTGLSRNVAVLVLEYFDTEGMTRRQGKGRELIGKPWKNS